MSSSFGQKGKSRSAIELATRNWLPISALLLRVGLFAFSQLNQLLRDRHELATPFSAYRRLNEGVFLASQGRDAYEGGSFHHAPIYLLLAKVFAIDSSLLSALAWIAADAASALALVRIWRERDGQRQSKWSATVAAVYLWHPYTIATCIARSTTAFDNALVLTAISYAVRGHGFVWPCLLALATHSQLYPIALLAPLPLLDAARSRRASRIVLRPAAICFVALAALTFGSRAWLGSWSFMRDTWGVMLVMSDQTPNVGLAWYFFTEMFPHFRTFFVGVYHLHALVYIAPVCIRLRKQPFLATVFIAGIIAIFKPYPTLGDSTIWLGLLGCAPEIWSELRYPLLAFALNLYAAILLPVLHDSWLHFGTGNANFFYAATMVYGLGCGMAVTDVLGAAIRYRARVQAASPAQVSAVPGELVVIQQTTLVEDSDEDAMRQASERTAELKRIQRNRKIGSFIHGHLWILAAALTFAGIAWLLALPIEDLGRGTFLDENAIQPGQVTTYWNWDDVHVADVLLDKLERVQGGTSAERAHFISSELGSLGLESDTLTHCHGDMCGETAYVIMTPPRATACETVLLSANWFSLSGRPNLRGIANLMAFARFLRGQNHWAKEFVFVFGDGYVEGLEAFLAAYHGRRMPGLVHNNLKLAPQGVIWTALNIDYPGHSFSHLGLYYEGINGALPNQDLVNTVAHISQYTAGAPVRLHSVSADLPDLSVRVPFVPQEVTSKYARNARHLAEDLHYAGFGNYSGAHGLFAEYRIDGLTVFAEPATGPHGFHALGIILESTARSMNNLLERLHASFHFFLFIRPGWFMKIGTYLPSTLLLGAAATFAGLKLWVDAGWAQRVSTIKEQSVVAWTRRDRDVGMAIGCLAAGLGLGTLGLLADKLLVKVADVQVAGIDLFWLVALLHIGLLTASSYMVAAQLVARLQISRDAVSRASSFALPSTIASIAHLFTGALISALAMINFPQSVAIAVLFIMPLYVTRRCVAATAGLAPSPSNTTHPAGPSTGWRFLAVNMFSHWQPITLHLLSTLVSRFLFSSTALISEHLLAFDRSIAWWQSVLTIAGGRGHAAALWWTACWPLLFGLSVAVHVQAALGEAGDGNAKGADAHSRIRENGKETT